MDPHTACYQAYREPFVLQLTVSDTICTAFMLCLSKSYEIRRKLKCGHAFFHFWFCCFPACYALPLFFCRSFQDAAWKWFPACSARQGSPSLQQQLQPLYFLSFCVSCFILKISTAAYNSKQTVPLTLHTPWFFSTPAKAIFAGVYACGQPLSFRHPLTADKAISWKNSRFPSAE